MQIAAILKIQVGYFPNHFFLILLVKTLDTFPPFQPKTNNSLSPESSNSWKTKSLKGKIMASYCAIAQAIVVILSYSLYMYNYYTYDNTYNYWYNKVVT